MSIHTMRGRDATEHATGYTCGSTDKMNMRCCAKSAHPSGVPHLDVTRCWAPRRDTAVELKHEKTVMLAAQKVSLSRSSNVDRLSYLYPRRREVTGISDERAILFKEIIARRDGGKEAAGMDLGSAARRLVSTCSPLRTVLEQLRRPEESIRDRRREENIPSTTTTEWREKRCTDAETAIRIPERIRTTRRSRDIAQPRSHSEIRPSPFYRIRVAYKGVHSSAHRHGA
ncbi:hypothetical protein DFS33DRAFT_1277240 [Desarmillaria ectypa]|nr:hypothetical protein DFS33DRAFT_1277240 [Desarmillaria ectypa]